LGTYVCDGTMHKVRRRNIYAYIKIYSMNLWHVHDRDFTTYTRNGAEGASAADRRASAAAEQACTLSRLDAVSAQMTQTAWDPLRQIPAPERRYRCDDTRCDFKAAPDRSGSGITSESSVVPAIASEMTVVGSMTAPHPTPLDAPRTPMLTGETGSDWGSFQPSLNADYGSLDLGGTSQDVSATPFDLEPEPLDAFSKRSL